MGWNNCMCAESNAISIDQFCQQTLKDGIATKNVNMPHGTSIRSTVGPIRTPKKRTVHFTRLVLDR